MPDEKKIDPFKPQQPVIPGVPAETPKKHVPPAPLAEGPARPNAQKNPLLWVGIAAAAVLVGAGIAWWGHSSAAKTPVPAVVAGPEAPAPAPPKPVERLPMGPGEIASADELAKPWSARKFIFRNPTTAEEVPALAVRLPGGNLWGISLREPYGTCELAYVTNLDELRTQYRVRAEHPMVVDPCNRVVYDLARYGGGPNGLVRGAIVMGTAVRPPIGIEIEERGNRILAARIENSR